MPGPAEYRVVARAAAERAGIDPDLFDRQIMLESGYSPTARSKAGASGIAQLMPQFHHVDVWNPEASLEYAAQLMATFLKTYGGDYRIALAAYNAGPGAVAQYGGVPPYKETQGYIRNIMGTDTGPGPQRTGGDDTEFDGAGVVARGARVRHGFHDPAYKAALGQEHQGVDLEMPVGTRVRSPVAGVVTFAGQDDSPGGAGGTGVKIQAANGRFISAWHLGAAGVKVGDQIRAGQAIGTSGQTGNAAYPHVHLQDQDGAGGFQDPMALLRGYRGGAGINTADKDDWQLDPPTGRTGGGGGIGDDVRLPDLNIDWGENNTTNPNWHQASAVESPKPPDPPFTPGEPYRPYRRKFSGQPSPILSEQTASPFADLLDPTRFPDLRSARTRGPGSTGL